MRVWLIHMGEFLQSDGPGVRLYRYGHLADALVSAGHQVVRWAPTFVPYNGKQRADHDTVLEVAPGHEVRLLHAAGYTRNVGPGRLRFHAQVARRWEEVHWHAPAPDLIVCGMPTPEACSAARRISAARGIPWVADIRDLWPDALIGLTPGWIRPVARAAVYPYELVNRRNMRSAAAITAVSGSYLDWGLRHAGRQAGADDLVFPLGYTPHAVPEAETAAAEARWRADLPEGRFLCLFFGTMGSLVDLDCMIDAARLLEARSPGRFEWVLAGDGPGRAAAVQRAAATPNVRMPGWVGGADVSALLRLGGAGLVACTPEATQSLPNKPFEYAAARLPIVSSLGGELAELIRSEGIGTSFDAGDPASLAAAVSRYADDPRLAAAHGAAGGQMWSEQFSAETVYRQMAKYLEGFTGRRPRTTRTKDISCATR